MNSVIDRLRQNQTMLALGVRTSRTTDIARMAYAAGYQILWVDLEHSTISLDETVQICGCASDLGLTPWVRVPERDYGVIGRVLDGGAKGIIVPRVEDAAQAQGCVTAARFPPLGQRSQIAVLPQLQFERRPAAELNRAIDDQTTIQVLLESRKGIDNAETIAAVQGVDILGVGMNDLSADLGCLGDTTNTLLTEACLHVIAAARKHVKLAIVGGIQDADHYAGLIKAGMAPLVMAGIDTDLLLGALRKRVEETRSLVSSPRR
jgi:2-keto-3-deoxy-L-rhamnonate aldolase RhmA